MHRIQPNVSVQQLITFLTILESFTDILAPQITRPDRRFTPTVTISNRAFVAKKPLSSNPLAVNNSPQATGQQPKSPPHRKTGNRLKVHPTANGRHKKSTITTRVTVLHHNNQDASHFNTSQLYYLLVLMHHNLNISKL